MFDLMHIYIKYTYVDLNHPIIDLNNVGITKYIKERQDCEKVIAVPFITQRQYYDQNFSDDLFYEKRSIVLQETFDIGNSDNLHYDEIYNSIQKVMPKECTIISDEIMDIIAKENGYDKFAWRIYDNSVGKSPIAYGGPEWISEFYGIRKKDNDTGINHAKR